MSYYGASASEPAGANAEAGITFSLSDALEPAPGVAPIGPIPTSPGTLYSWIMLLALEVTGTSTTSINNRTARLATAITAGLYLWAAAQPTYRRPVSGNKPPDVGTSGTTPTPTGAGAPASYALATTSALQWDNDTIATSGAGRNGDFLEVVFGVSDAYAGGGGEAAMPDVIFEYDEM